MTYLGEVPFTKDARAKVENSIMSYKRFARLEFEFEMIGEHTLGVHVKQTAAPTGKILTADELHVRAIGIFEDLLPAGYDVLVSTTPLNQD